MSLFKREMQQTRWNKEWSRERDLNRYVDAGNPYPQHRPTQPIVRKEVGTPEYYLSQFWQMTLCPSELRRSHETWDAWNKRATEAYGAAYTQWQQGRQWQSVQEIVDCLKEQNIAPEWAFWGRYGQVQGDADSSAR